MAELEVLGWSAELQQAFEQLEPGLTPARVQVEHRILYEVTTGKKAFRVKLSGRVRHHTTDRAALPAVGDWVAVRQKRNATIEHVLPRRTALIRKSAGEKPVPQVLATNIDTVMVVTSANEDINLRRVERYIATVEASGARALVVVNKMDLAGAVDPFEDALRPSIGDVPLLAISARTGDGIDDLRPWFGEGVTVALVGSSGVGKSTIANVLIGSEVQATGEIRERDGRGRHTTTQRCLIPFDHDGLRGVLIDTPGIRELEPWADPKAVAEAFEDIESLAEQCRFNDCAHQTEPDCAVRGAVAAGDLTEARLGNYHALRAAQGPQPR